MAAGQIVLGAVKLKLAAAERWFLAFLTGSACVSTVVLVLALLRWIFPWVLLVFAGVVLLVRILFVRGDHREASPAEPALDWRWTVTFWLAYLAFGLYYLSNAMAPEFSSDGTVYHVGLVTRYFDRHGLFPMRMNMFANMPAGTEMLFLFAYAFGRHSAAAMVHLLFLLSMPFGMRAYARRMGQPAAGVAGSLLFYAAPVVGKDGSIAYNDVSTAAIVFGCFYALQIWHRERRPAALVPAGLLAGFAFASKYTAFSVILYAAGFVVVSELRRRKTPWGPLAIIVLLVLWVTGPWMIKNIAYVADPVHPFLGGIFPNPYYAQRLAQDLSADMAHTNEVSYARIPWEVTIGGRLIGIIGPVFLLAPLALLSLRSSMGRHLLLAFIVIFLPYFGNIGARFLIPSLSFLAFALAAGLAWNTDLLLAALALHLLLAWPSLIPLWAPPNQWRLESFDWQAALRLVPEEKYLQLHLPDYRAGLMLDRFVPPDQLVYAPGMAQLAYHHRQTIGSNLERRALELLVTGYMPESSIIRKRRYRFAPVRTRTVRLALESTQDIAWRIHEVRFFQNELELIRRPQWRLQASDNPWEIQSAFDGSSVSSWVSSRRAAPGQWIQVDFGEPLALTSVTVEQLPDQCGLAQGLQATVDGRMVRIPAQEATVEEPLGPGLRRKVAAELKASGIQWLLLQDTDYGGGDMRRRAPYWGAEAVANIDGYYLWRLK